MTRERNILSQIIKNWAQEHDSAYQIASLEPGDEGVDTTSHSLSWVIKQTNANIDLLTLVDRLELYINNIKNKKIPDGMFCRKCQTFQQYAEPNQEDGSFLCYSCRSNPYT
jgi:hypothetical protein